MALVGGGGGGDGQEGGAHGSMFIPTLTFDHHQQILMYANLMLHYLGTISLAGQVGELNHNR